MARNIKSYAELAANPAYELMYEEYLGDIKTAGIVLRHKKSGARVCVLPTMTKTSCSAQASRLPPQTAQVYLTSSSTACLTDPRISPPAIPLCSL